MTLVDIGIDTMTGGCLLKMQKYFESECTCMTYGDGVSDGDIGELIRFHATHHRRAILSAFNPLRRITQASAVRGAAECAVLHWHPSSC